MRLCYRRRLHSHHGLKRAYPFKIEEGALSTYPGRRKAPALPPYLVRDAELIEHR